VRGGKRWGVGVVVGCRGDQFDSPVILSSAIDKKCLIRMCNFPIALHALNKCVKNYC